ncbi:hypothetical protein Anas_11352 [Armadillidium nasatum]|uniref:Uncharacterized protein n=1 Tax=Armadillidium nasatum TaxID=96803 RepID=A0A5N5TFX2_9CRUS|nr:hypothetical protein Anas_11352 [Armadillidium nasatum]
MFFVKTLQKFNFLCNINPQRRNGYQAVNSFCLFIISHNYSLKFCRELHLSYFAPKNSSLLPKLSPQELSERKLNK